MSVQRNLTGDHVARAALETLKIWLPAYLALQEDLDGQDPGTLPQPKSFLAAADNDSAQSEYGFPRVVVISPGMSGEPSRGPYNTGYRDAEFAIAAGAYLRGSNREETRALMVGYLAAIRLCLMIEGLEGLEDVDLDWVDETYDEVPGQVSRSEAGGEVAFIAHVDDPVVHTGSPWPEGPPDSPYLPQAEDPEVETVTILEGAPLA